MNQKIGATLPQADAKLQLDSTMLRKSFDRQPFSFEHNLSKLDLFQMDSLERLAHTMSKSPRDYFIAGNAPHPGTKFYEVANGGMEPGKAIENLDRGQYRVLLKRPEKFDSRFRELLAVLFRQVAEVRGDLRGEPVERLESALFISSGSTITPIHFDPEVAFFSQIEGLKTYHVYPPACASEVELERFYVRGRIDIGQVDISRLDASREYVFDLAPGKGMHQPQNAPHWVQTGNSRSVSYTFVFQTRSSRSLCRTRAFNYGLRKCGLAPAQPGLRPGLDAAKAGVMRTAVPLQFAGRVWNKAVRLIAGRRLSTT